MLVDEKFRIGSLIDKANESLGAAELLIEEQLYDEAVLRCYHTVFFTLRAFLKKNKIAVEKTSDSIQTFKKYFVDTKVIPNRLYHDFLSVINSTGLENVIDQSPVDELTARAVYEHADRFYSELSDLI